MLNSAYIGIVNNSENTNNTLCQEPSDYIPFPEVTQSLSNLQTKNHDLPMEPKSNTTAFFIIKISWILLQN